MRMLVTDRSGFNYSEEKKFLAKGSFSKSKNKLEPKK